MTGKQIVVLVALGIVLAAVVFFHGGVYSLHSSGMRTYRLNRFTGSVEVVRRGSLPSQDRRFLEMEEVRESAFSQLPEKEIPVTK